MFSTKTNQFLGYLKTQSPIAIAAEISRASGGAAVRKAVELAKKARSGWYMWIVYV
jgi:hypothetical protein